MRVDYSLISYPCFFLRFDWFSLKTNISRQVRSIQKVNSLTRMDVIFSTLLMVRGSYSNRIGFKIEEPTEIAENIAAVRVVDD